MALHAALLLSALLAASGAEEQMSRAAGPDAVGADVPPWITVEGEVSDMNAHHDGAADNLLRPPDRAHAVNRHDRTKQTSGKPIRSHARAVGPWMCWCVSVTSFAI